MAVAAVLHDHGPPRGRILAHLPQGRSLSRAPPLLGLGQQREALVQRDGEQLLLAGQAAAVGALLDERPVTAVLDGDLGAVSGIDAHRARQRQHRQRLLEGHGLQRHRLEQRRELGLVGPVLGPAELHVRPVPARLGQHLAARGGIGAEHPLASGPGQQFQRPLDGHLVGFDVVGHAGDVVAPLHAGAVAPHPDLHAHPVGVHPQRDRIDRAGVDVAEAARHLLLESRIVAAAEVEPAEPRNGLLGADGDPVEVVLHLGGERVVHQLGEVPLQQVHHREGHERRHQRRPLAAHVAPVGDGSHDRRVRGRPSHAELLETADQRGLRVAGRRLGAVAGRVHGEAADRVSLHHRRQPRLAVGVGRVARVGALGVHLPEAHPGDDGAARRELAVGAALGAGADPQLHGLADAVVHLARQRPLPHQFVEPGLVPGDLPGHRLGIGEGVARGPDGLVGLLGVLDLAGVDPRLGRQRRGTEAAGHGGARRGHRGRRQRRAVGPHVGDVALLVEPLRGAHRGGRRHRQLAGRLLLQRGRDERRSGAAPVRLGAARPHREVGAVEL